MKKKTAISERVLRAANRPAAALFAGLSLSTDGFTEEEARERRKKYGSNLLLSPRTDTLSKRLRRAFLNPFAVILLILAGISFITDFLLTPAYRRNLSTVPVLLLMLLISGLVRFWQEMRARKVIDHLSKMIEAEVVVRRDGAWQTRPLWELVVGDRVKLVAGDLIPADLRIIQADDLFISHAAITGESGALEKTAAILKEQQAESLAQYSNLAFMGTSVTGGSGEGIVLAVGKETAYGGLYSERPAQKNRFEHGAASIAWVLIRFMVILAPIVFFACGLTKGNWVASFLFALSVAVGLTPELLPMVVNACLTKGSAAMERKETVVRDINSMQAFGSMDVLCVDKTGTLTGDELRLEYFMDVLGNESKETLHCAYLNSLYHTGVHNPLDAAILNCRTASAQEVHRFDALAAAHPKLDELPFDYDRKIASTLIQNETQSILLVKGSVDAVCRRVSHISYRGNLYPAGEQPEQSIHSIVDEMSEDGMKVLAVAYKPLGTARTCMVSDETNLVLLGYLAFFDAPKQTAESALKRLGELQVDVRVLTGDQKDVTLSVCRRLGLCTKAMLTGSQLNEIPEAEAAMCIEKTLIFTELSPRQKAFIVQELQQNGHVVGFLGDGMNDLPAITAADVGISVDNAVEAVQEGADVILLKKDLHVLEAGILEGRKAFANMSKYIKITASSNFGNILAIVAASIFLPFLPMTALQLLLLNLLYDILCLVLPWDRVDTALYQKPREWSGRTLGRFMRFFGPLSSLFDFLTFGFLYFVLAPAVSGGPFGTLSPQNQTIFIAVFQTGWFLESMWTQVLILQLLRTQALPFLQSRPSRAVLCVTGFGVLLFTALAFTPLGRPLGLTVLPPVYFVFLAAVVPLYMLLVSMAKAIYVRKYHELI